MICKNMLILRYATQKYSCSCTPFLLLHLCSYLKYLRIYIIYLTIVPKLFSSRMEFLILFRSLVTRYFLLYCLGSLKNCWGYSPSSIYSWSISHNLEHEFFCLGRLGSSGQSGKKSGFEFFWATFEGGFFNILWAKKKRNLNIVGSAKKSCIISLLYFFS